LSVPSLEEGFALDHAIEEVGYTSKGEDACPIVKVGVGYIAQPIGYLIFIKLPEVLNSDLTLVAQCVWMHDLALDILQFILPEAYLSQLFDHGIYACKCTLYARHLYLSEYLAYFRCESGETSLNNRSSTVLAFAK
jgi:hypothetical protein